MRDDQQIQARGHHSRSSADCFVHRASRPFRRGPLGCRCARHRHRDRYLSRLSRVSGRGRRRHHRRDHARRTRVLRLGLLLRRDGRPSRRHRSQGQDSGQGSRWCGQGPQAREVRRSRTRRPLLAGHRVRLRVLEPLGGVRQPGDVAARLRRRPHGVHRRPGAARGHHGGIAVRGAFLLPLPMPHGCHLLDLLPYAPSPHPQAEEDVRRSLSCLQLRLPDGHLARSRGQGLVRRVHRLHALHRRVPA